MYSYKMLCFKGLFCVIFLLGSVVNTPLILAEEPLSYEQARLRLRQQSDAIKAADFHVDSSRDKRQSLNRLNYPTLSLHTGLMSYGLERKLDIEPLQQAIGQVISGADQVLPDSIDLDFNAVNPVASLSSNWYIYTGGRRNASRRLADANIEQSKAEREHMIEQQEKRLATLYFGHLLAKRVLAIREDVLKGVKWHLHQAERFEAKGVLSSVERLHAQVAYDEARRNLEQARADYGISDAALRHLLRSEHAIRPSTRLFVLTQALAPMSDFIHAGLDKHNQLALIRSQLRQAEEVKVIEQARWKPSLVAYGTYNLTQDDAEFTDPLPLLEPDWVVGINLTYPLFDRQNRRRLVSAAEGQVQRLKALEKELENGLVMLIEKSYRSLNRAREQFIVLESNIELAVETRHLRERLFEEGLGTSLDVVDARLSAARAETERAAAAYGFVVSLVDLLASSAQLEDFDKFLARADVRLSVWPTQESK